MNKSFFKSLTFLFIALMVLSAAACGRSGKDTTPNEDEAPVITKDPITLEYWRLFDESSVLDEFIKQYQREHPNITIEIVKKELKPGETIYDYQKELIKVIADGAGPDMFMMHNSWLPYHINQIQPIPTGLMSIKQYKENFPEVVQKDFIANNRAYAIPYTLDNLMLYYNTDLFSDNKIKEPPKTLQDLAELVPILTQKDSRGRITRSAIALGADTTSIPRAADILAALMMQYGTEMTSADNQKATFNLPTPNSNPPYFGGQEALAYYTQFADPRSPLYTYTDATDAFGNRQLPQDIQAFMQGKSAMFIGGAYHIKNIRKFAPAKFHFDTAPLPQLQLQDPVTLANYWGETVSKNSDSAHAAAAWDFIQFVAQKQNQSLLSRQLEAIPSHKSLLETSAGRRYYGPVALQIPYSKSWYRKNTPKVEELFSQMINSVIKNRVPFDVAIDTAVRDINALQ